MDSSFSFYDSEIQVELCYSKILCCLVGLLQQFAAHFLCSVLVHSGGVHGGHYYAFIRPTLSDQWYASFNSFMLKQVLYFLLKSYFNWKLGSSSSRLAKPKSCLVILENVIEFLMALPSPYPDVDVLLLVWQLRFTVIFIVSFCFPYLPKYSLK